MSSRRVDTTGARPMQPEWALAIRDQCQEQTVPFFFKQWGGVHKKKAGRVWDEYPVRVASAVRASRH